jgi:Tfp pilus assembly protein PilO
MRPERLWLLGGVVAAIVLLTVGFYLVIYPKYQKAADLEVLSDDSAAEVVRQRREIATLEAENKKIEDYRAQVKARLAALPETDSVAELLREVQTAGELTGVTVSGVSVGSATEVKVSGPLSVHALPVSLTAAGPAAKINPFLDQLQKTQPRALLIGNVNVATTTGDRAALTLTLQAFYASKK